MRLVVGAAREPLRWPPKGAARTGVEVNNPPPSAADKANVASVPRQYLFII
jgi:hypothetical protein